MERKTAEQIKVGVSANQWLRGGLSKQEFQELSALEYVLTWNYSNSPDKDEERYMHLSDKLWEYRDRHVVITLNIKLNMKHEYFVKNQKCQIRDIKQDDDESFLAAYKGHIINCTYDERDRRWYGWCNPVGKSDIVDGAYAETKEEAIVICLENILS